MSIFSAEKSNAPQLNPEMEEVVLVRDALVSNGEANVINADAEEERRDNHALAA